MTQRPFLVLAVLAVLSGGVACSRGGEGSSAASPRASNDARQVLELGRRFAQCAREHGYPNIRDPEIEDTRLVWPADEGADPKEQMRSVIEQAPECKAIMDELSSLTPQRESVPPPDPADMEKLRAFAKCMREHDIDGYPDPRADGSIPLIGTPLEAEGKSERILTAMDACKHLVDKQIQIS